MSEPTAQAEPPFAAEGQLDQVAARSIVAALFAGDYTGRIMAQQDKVRKVLYVEHGTPAGAKSNQIGETLLRLAKRYKVVDDAGFQAILEAVQAGTERLQGELMVEHGVKPATVESLLARQAALRFADFCRWERGRYQWAEGLPETFPASTVNPVAVFVEYVKLVYNPRVFKRVVATNSAKHLSVDAKTLERFQRAIESHPATKGLTAELAKLDGKPAKQLGNGDSGDQLKRWLGIQALAELGAIGFKEVPAGGRERIAKPTYEQRTDERQEDPKLVRLLARMEEQDYFEILGIGEDADNRAVKRAYFKLAKEYHPDRFFDRETRRQSRTAEAIFALINTAYEELKDKENRSTYLDYLKRGTSEEEEMKKAEEILQSEMSFQKAMILLKRKSYDEAIRYLNEAIEYHPDEQEYRIYRSWAQFLKASPDGKAVMEQAVRDMRQALGKLGRPHVEGQYLLGRMLKITGNTAEAERAFKKVLELDSSHKDAARELRALAR